MAVAYQDFVPELIKQGIFSSEYERLDDALARANAWLESSNVRLINIETVLLPNVRGSGDSSESGICVNGDASYEWSQIVRVWYHRS